MINDSSIMGKDKRRNSHACKNLEQFRCINRSCAINDYRYKKMFNNTTGTSLNKRYKNLIRFVPMAMMQLLSRLKTED